MSVLANEPSDVNSMKNQQGLSRRANWAAGQPIGHMMHRALTQPELISLAAGFVDQHSLPVEPMKTAIEAVLSDHESAKPALQYGTTAGDRVLRKSILQELLSADRVGAAEMAIDLDQVVITAGSNQMLHLINETLLDPGDIVCCGSPSYFVYLGLLANAGARAFGIEVDQRGMVPGSLDASLERLHAQHELERVKAIYIVSYFDNPCSITLAEDRRAEIVELARRWSERSSPNHTIYVIEDVAYRKLRYDGTDIPSLRRFDHTGDTVIQTGTFSKSFAPGIRIGWGILPKRLVNSICNQKGNIDFGTANFNQVVMSRVLTDGLFESHLDNIRTVYRTKRQAMLAAADEHLGPLPGVHWIRPNGGLYVWLTLPEAIDAGPDGPLFDLALEGGVMYVPGEYCFPGEGVLVQRNTIRLSFGVQTPDRIAAGIRVLGAAIHQLQS